MERVRFWASHAENHLPTNGEGYRCLQHLCRGAGPRALLTIAHDDRAFSRGVRERLEMLATRAVQHTVRHEIQNGAIGWKRTSAYVTHVRISYHLSSADQRSGGRMH